MAITSETQIANNALIRLGANPITDIDVDGTHNSNTMQQLYAPTRDALLRQHFWNFAIKRVSIAENATPPAFQWTAQYTLPSDFVRVKRLYNTDDNYAIEGDVILVNQPSELQMVYVARITDVTRFDPLFVQVLTLMLAILAAPRICGEGFNTDRLAAELRQTLMEAKIVDSQDSSPEDFIINTFANARYGSYTDIWNITTND